MNEAARFKRIEELFHAVQRLPQSERADFLSKECGDDTDLRQNIESLLEVHQGSTEDFRDNLSESLAPRTGYLEDGARIGPYRIISLIAEGGMGEVYRAEQSHPLRREVALKLVKAGMDTHQILARFENERQALALMNHPGIARVYDAGSTPSGRLYFAMQLVGGEPINEFCDASRMPLADRLALFQRVCEAVQHAHQKGIIHRDLKPSNILVEEQDGRPRPKIIDFGIAKVVIPETTGHMAETRIGQSVGTPEYMSPEQAKPDASVDTRSDVYSLGMVLYELLVGRHPFDVKKLRAMAPHEIWNYIRNKEPVRPSVLAAESDKHAATLGCDPARLQRSLSGDLDWIVTKALEKEPDRRYASASELAADIGRHLRNEPVVAGSPSRAYRARKFVRRHRWPVITASLIFLVLLSSIVAISAALVRANRAESDALQQATTANEVTDILASLIAAEDPYGEVPDRVTARDIVNQAARRIEAGGINDPEVYSQLTSSLASVMLNQGLHEESLELTRQAIGRLREAGPNNGVALLELLYEQSRAESLLGRYGDARRTADQLVDLATKTLPPDSHRLGAYYKQRGDAEDVPGGTHEAQEYWHRRALAILKAAPRASPEDLGAVLYALAGSTSDAAECTNLAQEALGIWQDHLGPRHPRVAEALYVLGRCARLVGDVQEAEKQQRAAYELQKQVLGPTHPLTFKSTFQLQDTLYELGRFDEAQRLTQTTLADAQGVDQQATVAILLNQSFTYLPASADFEAYRQRLDESVALFLELYDGESEWSLMARHTRADGLGNWGLLASARDAYLEVMDLRQKLGLPQNYYQALLLDNLAMVERRMGLLDEAERHINEALELYPSSIFDPRYHARALLSKATLLYLKGDPEAAQAAFDKSSELYAACRGPRTFQDLRYAAAWHAVRAERNQARELVLALSGMGVHPDFLANEPELLALFGENELRRLAGGAVEG